MGVLSPSKISKGVFQHTGKEYRKEDWGENTSLFYTTGNVVKPTGRTVVSDCTSHIFVELCCIFGVGHLIFGGLLNRPFLLLTRSKTWVTATKAVHSGFFYSRVSLVNAEAKTLMSVVALFALGFGVSTVSKYVLGAHGNTAKQFASYAHEGDAFRNPPAVFIVLGMMAPSLHYSQRSTHVRGFDWSVFGTFDDMKELHDCHGTVSLR